MEDFEYLPLEGLFSIEQKGYSGANVFDAISLAEEKIFSSPKGRTKTLESLLYLIRIMKDAGLPFYVKGGVTLHYYLKQNARPTRDLDILIREDPEAFLLRLEKAFASQSGGLALKIGRFSKKEADASYYFDTFSIPILFSHEGEVVDTLYIDGVSSPIYDKIAPKEYPLPAVVGGSSFLGVPLEFSLADKINAITNELKRPYKHLVDAYSILQQDIDIPLAKKYLAIIQESDDEVRHKLHLDIPKKPYVILDDKPFVSSYIFPAIQAGYTMSLKEMKAAVNHWLKDNLGE